MEMVSSNKKNVRSKVVVLVVSLRLEICGKDFEGTMRGTSLEESSFPAEITKL